MMQDLVFEGGVLHAANFNIGVWKSIHSLFEVETSRTSNNMGFPS